MLKVKRYIAVIFAIVLILALGMAISAFLLPQPPPGDRIETSNGYGVDELVRDIFASSACDNITNIKAIGNQQGIGYFDKGESSIGLRSGIILSTGPVENAEGPNAATDFSGDFDDESGDPDLNLMVSNDVFDAVGIEFDFEPLDSFVTFRYVFASEEYCEFVGSIYNDVFGFFISGPGINGNFSNNSQNVALIPGTNNFVSINAVNHNSNSNYYISNELMADAEQCNKNFALTAFRNQIEFDGFTTELTAVLKLAPCETYHIRLVVADVADAFYDSAVFLEAGSFNLGGRVSVSGVAAEDTTSNIVFEGCPQGYFEFSRVETNRLLLPVTVSFKVSDESTAVSGVDYAPITQNTITIPPGHVSVQLPIEVFNDNTTETLENLILELDIPCSCYSDTATLVLSDPPPMQVILDDLAVCEAQSGTLAATIEGGIPPFQYEWSNSATTESLEVPADGPLYYKVTITDACGTVSSDSCNIFITQPPTAILSGYADICEGDTAYFNVDFTGIGPWHLTYAIDGMVAHTFSEITTNPFAMPVTQGGMYEIVYFEDNACEGQAMGDASIDMAIINIDTTIKHVSCAGGNDGWVEVNISGGVPPLQWSWSTGNPNQSRILGLSTGTIHLYVQDAKGCRKNITIPINEPPPLSPLQVNCELLIDGQFGAMPEGGVPPYRYSVDGDNFFDETLFSQLNSDQVYSLSIMDANGCLFVQDWQMPELTTPIVQLPEHIKLKFGETATLHPELQVPESQIANLRWITTESLDCTDCLEPTFLPLRNSSFILKVFDIYGCSYEFPLQVEVEVKADYYVPNAFSPNGDQINDRLTVFANTYQVQQVLSFKVFDRWGGMCYAANNFQPNTMDAGWDGATNGLPRDNGIYVYLAKLLLIDGQEIWIHGNVLLVR